jgi:alpha-methylacyl-CoA racemase
MADRRHAGRHRRTGSPDRVVRAPATTLFASRPRAHWCELLEGSDVCFAPVLSLAEAAGHPHMAARGIYRTVAAGAVHPAAAPRFEPLAGEAP